MKHGGKLVVDIYEKSLKAYIGLKYIVRAFTNRSKDPVKLYSRIQNYIDFIWPLSSILLHIPLIGTTINWKILIVGDYSRLGLKGKILKEWAYLDTYDILSPWYDYPQTASTLKKWFAAHKAINIDVQKGYNGIEGRGTIQWTD